MLSDQYIDGVSALIANFRAPQGPAPAAGAELSAVAVACGGALHHFDTGHCRYEPIRRAGGLIGLHHIEVELGVEHAVPPLREDDRTVMRQQYFYDREELAPIVLDKSNVREGDVLIQVSNSGKEPFTVGVGLEAQARGAKLVALTSVEFSMGLEPAHSSGRRLCEAADVVIDMGSPPGDAILDVEGVGTRVGPTSGVLTTVALWSLTCQIVEEMTARGINPSIYRSVNEPDGFAFNQEAEAQYRRQGICARWIASNSLSSPDSSSPSRSCDSRRSARDTVGATTSPST